jgi:ubiquinone/menaquinone biosynthesis C-methylase UbiE
MALGPGIGKGVGPMSETTEPDFAAITERLQKVWATGDFGVLAPQIMTVSEKLIGALDPRAGDRILDVACGTGNATLVAARRYCEVTGIDYVPAFLERARLRAAAEGMPIDYQEADAQALPFPDASFDAVVSVFGVIFAPDQERAAAELLRVCRPGGKIALAAWMPEGFGGDLFSACAQFLPPPPPGVRPPVRWGTDEGLDELLGEGVSDLTTRRCTFFQHFRSIDHGMEVNRKYCGPTIRALEAVGPGGEDALMGALSEVVSRYDEGTPGGPVVMRCEYLQVAATRA